MMTTVGFAQSNSFLLFLRSQSIEKTKSSRAKWVTSSSSSSSHLRASSVSHSSTEAFHRTDRGQAVANDGMNEESRKKKKRVFFLDVSPLCYEGNKPSSQAFGHWLSLFFSQVSLTDPVIAVLDGEEGNKLRRELLPSYKAHRKSPNPGKYSKRPHQFVEEVLRKCNVPVVRIQGHEADDVVATLMEQAVQRGHRAVIASPDKDFKQLISENVQIVIPLADLRRWSFYTLKHYHAQYNCDPQSDLSFRCIMGDEVDGVPGIQHVVPAFGRKTAMKLVRKHGSLENLLSAAAVRTVGRPYAQEALTKYADYLRRNYQVLALKRDVKVQIEEEWLVERDTSNDSEVLSSFFSTLHG
ncbi:hypothetical protein BRARA_I02421 [Brassica rapa]|uniref:5'-3' exonuclease domain-containing protein n=1 Tax=Brassica campestris TaxID=3711 RepID=A0A397XXM8_BRACM|nr:5'-3' exonuclease [Brassica rapa]RID45717.1 hypothetical protein BRARA_I02421 [Brassica rapa]CAG7863826.1 unnamed protein product [Brassica rapa]VDC61137.1 unnamed protein product [Brassica rapa]